MVQHKHGSSYWSSVYGRLHDQRGVSNLSQDHAVVIAASVCVI